MGAQIFNHAGRARSARGCTVRIQTSQINKTASLATAQLSKQCKGEKLIVAFLDFENHFNAIGLECLFEILEKFGMAKEDVGVLKQYYEYSYFQVAQETRMPPFAHTRGGGRERADQVAGK